MYQHFIKDSDRTGMKINPCGLAIGVGGDISVAFADSLLRNRQSYRQSKMNSSLANVIDPGKSTNLSQSQTALMPTSPPGVTCSISALQQSNSSSNSSINTLPSVSQSNPNASAFSFSAATSTSSLVKRISLFQTSNQNTPSGSLQNSHVRTLSQSIASAAVASGSPATSNRNHVVASGSNTSLISPPKLYSSSLFYLRNDSDNCFVQSALRYELSGQSLSDLCEHNADVAQHLDRPNVAVTWRILKQLYAGQQTQMHSQLSSTTLGLAGDEKQDEFRHRHKSGHASRHPSGSTVTTMNVIIAPNSTLNVSGSSVVSGSVGVANTSGLNSVSAARSTHLSGSGNRRSGNNSGSVASNTVPIASSAVTPRPTSLGPSQSLSLSLKLPDSDSEIEVNDLLPTPTEKEFNREHQDFFFGDGDVSQSVANLTSFDIAPTDNLTHFEGNI